MRVLVVEDEPRMASVIRRSLAREGFAADVAGRAEGARWFAAAVGLRRGAARIDLAAKEFALLETFMRRPGEVLSRLELIEHAWDYAYENRSNVVDVYVRRLREKVDRPFDRSSIETVRGVGYRLRED